MTTVIAKRVLPRLRECSRQVEAEVVSNSSNKIHQTWEALCIEPFMAAKITFLLFSMYVDKGDEC